MRYINKNMYIYKTTNLANGKFYIGLSRKSVEQSTHYLGSGIALKKAIKKYGKENFKKEILEECNSTEMLDEREKYWIFYFNATGKDGYNITSGGYGNTKGMKGKKHSDETRQKLRNANLGRFVSEETKQKMSNSLKGKEFPPMTNETKQKISNGHKGLKHSEETRQKMSNSRKGKLSGPESVTCPHCGKNGKSNAMYRWHFNNCDKK
jgi:group I intron endonuclease